jgi:hypothetical protein
VQSSGERFCDFVSTSEFLRQFGPRLEAAARQDNWAKRGASAGYFMHIGYEDRVVFWFAEKLAICDGSPSFVPRLVRIRKPSRPRLPRRANAAASCADQARRNPSAQPAQNRRQCRTKVHEDRKPIDSIIHHASSSPFAATPRFFNGAGDRSLPILSVLSGYLPNSTHFGIIGLTFVAVAARAREKGRLSYAAVCR